MAIPITQGSGATSVASEKVGNNDYQQVKIIGGQTGSTSVWGVNPDNSANVSVVGVVSAQQSGTVISSLVSTVPSSVIVGASVFGNVGISGTPNVNTAGSVVAFQGGAWTASLVSATPSSVIVGASIFGLPPVNVTNTNLNVGGSVVAFISGTPNVNTAGSVVAFQGTSPWAVTNAGSIITVWQNSSVLAVPVGSVIAVVQGSVAQGVFSSPSVVQGTADLRVVQGGSVAALASPGAGIRTYVTAVQISNFGSSSVLVKISDNTTSTLGWTIAPAGGGSNYNPLYRSAAASPITASINATASVLVSMQGYTSSS